MLNKASVRAVRCITVQSKQPSAICRSFGTFSQKNSSELHSKHAANANSVRRGYKASAPNNAQVMSSGASNNFVRIVEVSPRDGLQNLPPPAVPTDLKLRLVEKLLEAGLTDIEVGSFVRGDRIPQMADTATLLPQLPPWATSSPRGGKTRATHYPVLVPNMRGLESLLKLEEATNSAPLTDEIAVFVSATEAFSQANNNASVEKVLSKLPPVIEKAQSSGRRIRGYVSCVMTDPYSGATPPEQVLDVAERLLEMGCYEISLGDTTGEGNPERWSVLWQQAASRGIDPSKMAAHCHDTFSMALASIIALLPHGLRNVDSSLAGLGGCPYSPGATGNVPTEDVVYALHKLGYDTGVDLEKLVAAGNWLSEALGIRNESRVGRAMWARMKLRQETAA